jgi:CDP-paratose 2-epimerase
MSILIIGGAGAIGSNIARYFHRHDRHVVVMDNLVRYGVHNNLADFKSRGIEFIHGDVRCKEDFDRLPLRTFGTVIDCAAQPTAVDGYDNPMYDYTNNTAGLINTLEYVREMASTLIFFSTNKVYSADVVNQPPTFEDATRYSWHNDGNGNKLRGFNPLKGFGEDLTLSGGDKSIYGASKASADIFVREWSEAFGVPAIVNRFSCLAGPYQWGKPEQGWITWWMIAAMLDLPIQYFGWNGKQVRDVLFTDDICALLEEQVMALEMCGSEASDMYNVGGGMDNTLSLLEATKLVEQMTGKRLNTEYIDSVRKADHGIYISDISKVSSEFDWQPRLTIEEGYNQIYGWVQENLGILEAMYK